MNNNEDQGNQANQEKVDGEIFADKAGKDVYDAFEKLGNEINSLTDNLERQFEDAEDGEDFLGGFNLKGIATSLGFISNNVSTSDNNVKNLSEDIKNENIEDEDLVELLNSSNRNPVQHSAEIGQYFDEFEQNDASSSPSKGNPVKRDSVGASSIDADSIASGGSRKISVLINHMRNRSLSADESSITAGGASITGGGAAVDEWDNDDDTGYTIITLSQEEFFDYEEETSAKILAERKEEASRAKFASYAAAAAKAVASPEKAAERPCELPTEPSVYEPEDSDSAENIVVDLRVPAVPHNSIDDTLGVGEVRIELIGESMKSQVTEMSESNFHSPQTGSECASPSKEQDSAVAVTTSTGERSMDHGSAATATESHASATTSTGERALEHVVHDPTIRASPPSGAEGEGSSSAHLAAQLAQGGFGGLGLPPAPSALTQQMPPRPAASDPSSARATPEITTALPQKAPAPVAGESRRQSVGEQRRSEIMGQRKFVGVDGVHCYFNLKVIFEPYKTGFEESKDLQHPRGTVLAGRYEVHDVLGQAAFSTALQCMDLAAEEDEAQWVCLKVIKNNKDFFDQSLDEIKLLQYINSCADPDKHHVLRLIDFFYCKEHLFIVSELLKENLYEFGRFIRESNNEPYYTMPRLKRIMKQVLEALVFIHSLKLIHCDIKPENIVIKSFSRCEVKLIDFGSSCFTSDHLTTYIQSRSYRAPEVILGHPYDTRIDIWSVGAVLAELHTGYVLFQNDSVPTMLSRITGILGQFPPSVLQRGKDTGKYFSLSNIVYERDEDGSFHLIFPKRTDLAARLHMPTGGENSSTGKLSVDEELFVDFTRQMLHLDPAQRMTAEEALQHPWLHDADTVYVSEYIIQQPQGDQPPLPEDQDEYGDEVDDEDESSVEGDESEEYDYEDDDLEAAQAEEEALQYLLSAHGSSAEAMEAYLQQLREQQGLEASDEDREEGECSSGDQEEEEKD